MNSLLVKSDSSVNGKLVNEMKRLWFAKVSRNGLVINFDNYPKPQFGYLVFSIELEIKKMIPIHKYLLKHASLIPDI